MLSLIKDRLTRSVFDDVMEVAWSTMWNVTDETAINCRRFLKGRGMEYFLKCLRVSKKKVWGDRLYIFKLCVFTKSVADLPRSG